MKKLTTVAIGFILTLSGSVVYSQTESDYLNLLFTDPVNPKDHLLYAKVDSLGQLLNYYTSLFPFSTESFYTSFDSLTHTPLQHQSDSLLFVNVTLNGKTATSYSYFKPGTDHPETALFIVPGSGYNGSGDIYRNDPSNYQNTNALISEAYRNQGDVYTYIKPNEDILAINRNGKKLDRYSIYAHLLNEGRSYSSNYLIQCLGFIKALKNKYDRVIIMGLSQGGYASLLLSLLSEPTASVVSSGYSILIENDYYADLNQIIIDDLSTHFSKEKIYEMIDNKSTYYLFSWGIGESAYYGIENLNLTTYNYFSSTHKVFYYNQNYGHTFPQKPAMENYLTLNNLRPLVFVEKSTNCEKLEEDVVVKVFGDLPIKFRVSNDSELPWEYIMEKKVDTIRNLAKGSYTFTNPQNLAYTSIYHTKLTLGNLPRVDQLSITSADFDYRENQNKWVYKYETNLDGLTEIAFVSPFDTIRFASGEPIALPGDYYEEIVFSMEGGCTIVESIDLLLERPSLGCYPNPVEDILNIEVHFKSYTALIYDSQGRKSGMYGLEYGKNPIDFSGASPGIYLVELLGPEGNQTFKIMKK